MIYDYYSIDCVKDNKKKRKFIKLSLSEKVSIVVLLFSIFYFLFHIIFN